MSRHRVTSIIKSRKSLVKDMRIAEKSAQEGGCGVIGVACTEPIPGRHFFTSLKQMRNRGNGKGGGVALIGLSAEQMGVSEEILQNDYIIQVAFLEPSCKEELEARFIRNNFEIHAEEWVKTIDDYNSIGLEVAPPQVYRYFARVKGDVLQDFIAKNGLQRLSLEEAEDEFIYQNTYRLNKTYYASLGEKKAFVLSHGKNMLVFKLVGYAEQVIKYYCLEDVKAHVWIGHHRYPTKGVVWHPGGAHPFIGLNEALVHNGDFSNYHSVSEYLAQQNIYPLFLTDTEVSVYLFDLWSRVYRYPLEYVIEALAPTTERDFLMLPPEKQVIYRELQQAHIHGSPDGPWFFIIARSVPQAREFQLIGITDTSMLRPQVFALQEGRGGVRIGLVASERQAIDAFLLSLSETDSRFSAKADLYWNARGGSHADGGAFIFRIFDTDNGKKELACINKFGIEVPIPRKSDVKKDLAKVFTSRVLGSVVNDYEVLIQKSSSLYEFVNQLLDKALDNPKERQKVAWILTMLLDRLHLTPYHRNGRVRANIEHSLFKIFRSFPYLHENKTSAWLLVDWDSKERLRSPKNGENALLMDVSMFPPEGEDSAALFIVKAYKLGWKHVFAFDWRGQRFCGSGLGPNTQGFRLDVYGNPGDYLGSGLDGAEIYVHCSAQDQVAQIMKSGKLVIYGDVGQTFMYGAKGGEVYVLGNAAGRPLINAVGRPRVVINGTCLDYLAESFMAGNPLNGGGFVILNGITFDDEGLPVALETPYPGSNLFSLASGGAIYIRDPNHSVDERQLNGGRFARLALEDWKLIRPYLEENYRLFGIPLNLEEKQHDSPERTHDRPSRKLFEHQFRKVEPVRLKVLT